MSRKWRGAESVLRMPHGSGFADQELEKSRLGNLVMPYAAFWWANSRIALVMFL